MNLIPNRTRQSTAAFGLRMVLWLFTLLAIVETPLGTGDLYGHGLRLANGAISGELPPRFATHAESRYETTTSATAGDLIRSAIVTLPDLDEAVAAPLAPRVPSGEASGTDPVAGASLPVHAAVDYDAQAPPPA